VKILGKVLINSKLETNYGNGQAEEHKVEIKFLGSYPELDFAADL